MPTVSAQYFEEREGGGGGGGIHQLHGLIR